MQSTSNLACYMQIGNGGTTNISKGCCRSIGIEDVAVDGMPAATEVADERVIASADGVLYRDVTRQQVMTAYGHSSCLHISHQRLPIGRILDEIRALRRAAALKIISGDGGIRGIKR